MINLCSNGTTMSICTEKRSSEKQRTCGFFIKATNEPRCMFLVFDCYCQCINAQDHRDGKLKDEEEDYTQYYESN